MRRSGAGTLESCFASIRLERMDQLDTQQMACSKGGAVMWMKVFRSAIFDSGVNRAVGLSPKGDPSQILGVASGVRSARSA